MDGARPGPGALGDTPAGTLGIVGLGLIGGSVALDAVGRGWPVVATDTDPDQRAAAAAAGIAIVDDLPAIAGAAVAPVLQALDAAASAPLLATTVASVQDPRVLGIEPDRLRWVAHLGGHPMTGTERSGFRAARRGMFDGSPWIVTARPDDLVGHLRRVVDLALALDAAPVVLPPDEHDRTVALLSHVPHVLAYGLYGRLAATGDHGAELLAGGSFRDATRVAATAPGFWADVLDLNREAVASLVADVRDALAEVEGLLRDGAPAPTLEEWLARGQRRVGRPVPSVPDPTPLPAADATIGAAAYAALRDNVRTGLAIAGWTGEGAATWAPM